MKTRVVILAAGQGKRMRSELPKVLVPFKGVSLISYVLDAVKESNVDEKPIIVVGVKSDMVKEALGPSYSYVHQTEQLGTGHAVQSAREAVGSADAVLTLYGDMPLISAQTIKQLRDTLEKSGAPLAMATTRVENFDDWREPLYDFGRVIRGANGEIARVVELRDASDEEKKIMELNPSFFCFRAAWLWEKLATVDNKNAQGEYYLVDLVRIAVDGGDSVASIEINPLEAIGVNTPEHLELAKRLAK